MSFGTRTARILAFGALVFAAACDSAEERAEAHFQSGLELLESGDVDRALVEFRNVFKLDGYHREARRAYAEIEQERGNLQSAYSHYLRLVEQHPDDFEARKALLKLATRAGDWEAIELHLRQVSDAPADDPVIRLSRILLDYRQAVQDEDLEAAARLAEAADALKSELPDEPALYEVRIDYLTRASEFEAALAEIDAALEVSPEERTLYQRRLSLLERLGDVSGVEEQLREMVETFPDDPQIDATLVRWHISRGNLDAAETFLRERLAKNGATTAERIDLVQFLTRYRSREAALDELDRMIAEASDDLTLRSMHAAMIFEAGDRESAIEEMTKLVEATEPSEQLDNLKINLAKMLVATGNEVGARSLVEEVLESDPTQVDALKMRANWLIDQDATDEAIITLREALDQSPRDPEILTLMAHAHERAGSRDLMGEMLSLAVDASNNAPDETIRYARFLASDDKYGVAEGALVDALRVSPNHVGLLQTLGSVYLAQQDWTRAEQIVETLKRIDDEAARAAANNLSAQLLAGQGKTSEMVSFVEDLIEEGEGGIGARLAIVRAHLQEGRIADAEAFIESELQRAPDNASLRFLAGSVAELKGDVDEAEAVYESIIKEQPEASAVWRALYMLRGRAGRTEEATETLDAALEANPENLDLLWAKASELQQKGSPDEAIDVYERMYRINTNAAVVANNLASLLTTVRDDADSLDRAYTIARRLRNVDVPAFQDTYGWIAFLRGDYDDALAHLEPASEGLPDDALTQYHLARTYQALDRPADALAQYRKAVEVAGTDSSLPQIEEARSRIAELEAAPAETE